jgi:hypothetical protein
MENSASRNQMFLGRGAIEKGQQVGFGLDQIRAFSRHRTLATMLIYRDEHDREQTYRTLADVVASSLTGADVGA